MVMLPGVMSFFFSGQCCSEVERCIDFSTSSCRHHVVMFSRFMSFFNSGEDVCVLYCGNSNDNTRKVTAKKKKRTNKKLFVPNCLETLYDPDVKQCRLKTDS